MSDTKSIKSKSEFKERRDKLFWNGKPVVRDATPADQKWLKLAAKMAQPERWEELFPEYLAGFSNYDEVFIVEDKNEKFGEGSGPVCVVAAFNNGWMMIPHVDWFPWATPKNKLRCQVHFLHKARFQDIGVIRIHAPNEHGEFFKQIKKYIPVFYLGYIPGGDEFGRGDDHIFFMKGKKQYKE